MQATPMDRIVVGVDGSEGSRAALAWAAGEAHLRGAALEIVHAFRVPFDGGASFAPLMLEHDEFRNAAQIVLDQVLATLDPCWSAVPRTAHVVEGPASTVLIGAGEGAAMIVVGSRGQGGITGMLMGSVSRQVSEHASVPVVVVPAGSQG